LMGGGPNERYTEEQKKEKEGQREKPSDKKQGARGTGRQKKGWLGDELAGPFWRWIDYWVGNAARTPCARARARTAVPDPEPDRVVEEAAPDQLHLGGVRSGLCKTR
jgi:hypothetical protein